MLTIYDPFSFCVCFSAPACLRTLCDVFQSQDELPMELASGEPLFAVLGQYSSREEPEESGKGNPF